LAAIVAAQIITLKSFPAFLMAYSDRSNVRRKLGKLDEALQINPQFVPAWEACATAT
jgi:hypothetical protein